MNLNICPICSAGLHAGIEPWHSICKICKYEKANFVPSINTDLIHQRIDEEQRAIGLKALRMSNFKVLIRRIKALNFNSKTLLDVGCAHGWFLELAQNTFQVLGVEPDKQVFENANRKNFPMRLGYFPDVLNSNEKFDVIVFNDVIEHIRDLDKIVQSCWNHLNSSGLLVLNVPNSSGIFYRISKIFHLLGYPGFFSRMWQKDFPSPHLHYFNKTNLSKLVLKYGFEEKYRGVLPSVDYIGLYQRITYTKEMPRFYGLVIFSIISLLIPLLKIMPSDIVYSVSLKK